ncbi:MAG: hypothetical protein JNJ61_14845, partial [Anaerolineae bacterium]|nr:hypothetical protein [Anaerolineae bacterium]
WSKLPQRRKVSKLELFDLLTPWLVLGGLLYLLRRLETWLHQHIFKVGWLLTHQFQTTTILYYAFFLPGIVINQFMYWAVAGLLNVRADRAIAWPEKQEIGELKLSFVKLSKNVDAFRLALISSTPLIVGIILIWHIANNILNVPGFLNDLRGNYLFDFTEAAARFTAAQDFWLWVYVAFTISNTMMPDFRNLRGWRIVLTGLGVIIVVLYALGAGNAVIFDALKGPITNSLNALSSIFAVIIGLNLFMVAVLGTIEALVERVTGHSATFKDGKMVAMTRQEMLAQRSQALAPQSKAVKPTAAPIGTPTVYRLPLPLPGAPGKEPVSRASGDEGLVISQDPLFVTPTSSISAPRSTPSMIAGSATEKPPTSAKPALPANVKPDDSEQTYEDFEDPA